MKHQLFIVSYYWPPAGGPGVQRWLKFVKYLPKDLFEITVVIPDHPDYASEDRSMLDEIPEGIQTVTIPIKEPSRILKKFFGNKTKKLQRGFINKKPGFLEKLLLWVRGNYFIPDARISWVDPVVRYLESDAAFAKADTLITTGPPHSVHLTGLALRNKFPNLTWIADFRDPWTTIGYHKSLRLSEKAALKHEQLEKRVLNTADQLIVTSPSTQTEFQTKTNKPINVITNGFDVTPNKIDQPPGKFTLSHIGTLLANRDPKNLWRILAELCEEEPDFSRDFELQLAGNVSPSVKESIAIAGLDPNTNYLGYISHDRAVALMNQSQVLLLIEIDSPETKAIIPGKTFEYIASRRPVVAIGPKESDIEALLEHSGAGNYYTYDAMHLKQHILKSYQSYQQGTLDSNTADVSRYHRKELTQQLAHLILN